MLHYTKRLNYLGVPNLWRMLRPAALCFSNGCTARDRARDLLCDSKSNTVPYLLMADLK